MIQIWFPEECPLHHFGFKTASTSDDWKRPTVAVAVYECGCEYRIKAKHVRRYSKRRKSR